MAILATYRDTEVERTNQLAGMITNFGHLPSTREVTLAGLGAPAMTDFVRGLAGHDLDVEGEAFARRVGSADGRQSFFAGEVLRHLAETGGIERRDGCWAVTAQAEALVLPSSVRDVIGRRVDQSGNQAGEPSANRGGDRSRNFGRIYGGITRADVETCLDACEAAVGRSPSHRVRGSIDGGSCML